MWLADSAEPSVRELTEAMTFAPTSSSCRSRVRWRRSGPTRARPSGWASSGAHARRVGTEDLADIRAMCEQVAAAIPGARLETIEGAGHLPSLERPAELNRLLLDFLAEHGVRERWARPRVPSRRIDGRSGTRARGRASGSTQRKVARCRRSGRRCAGELREPVQCGDLRRAARSRGPSRSGPCGRSRAARRRGPGTAPTSPRPASPARRASDAAAPAPKRTRSSRVPCRPRRGDAASSAPQPERPEHRRLAGTPRTASRRAPRRAREHLEAGVRVDPPLARARDRRAVLERQPGRVREQMAHRRALRPGRLVEVEVPSSAATSVASAVDELRHRRPAEACSRGRARATTPAAAKTPAAACSAGQPSICAERSTAA